VSLGCALTVVALAFQPFTQQSISFLQRPTPSGSATIQYVGNLTDSYIEDCMVYFVRLANVFWNIRANSDNLAGNGLPLSFWAVVYNASATPYLSPSNVTASCPSGNCTFDTYHSLGLCALPAVNLTHQIIATPNSQGVDCSTYTNGSDLPSCTYKLPNRVILDTDFFIPNVTSATHLDYVNGSTDSIAYPEFYSGIPIDFFVIYVSPNTGYIVAMEYALCFYGQTYNSSVTGGQTLTTIISTCNTIPSVYGSAYGASVVIEGPVVFNISQDNIDKMMGASQDIFQGIQFVNSEYVFTTDISMPDKDISISAQAIAIALAQTGNESAAMDVFMNNLAISLTSRFVTPITSIPSLALHN
jgi:hypothetical protein